MLSRRDSNKHQAADCSKAVVLWRHHYRLIVTIKFYYDYLFINNFILILGSQIKLLDHYLHYLILLELLWLLYTIINFLDLLYGFLDVQGPRRGFVKFRRDGRWGDLDLQSMNYNYLFLNGVSCCRCNCNCVVGILAVFVSLCSFISCYSTGFSVFLVVRMWLWKRFVYNMWMVVTYFVIVWLHVNCKCYIVLYYTYS